MKTNNHNMRKFQRTRYADCNGSEKSEDTEITVNIGGVKHILYGDVLNRYPETRLAELLNRATDSTHEDLSTLCDDYDDINREFYFDRDPEAFKCILELYYYGEIHIKTGICPMTFMKEMEFWGIDAEYLDECCISSLNEVETEQAEIAEKVKTILDDLDDNEAVSRAQKWQVFLWNLLEKPQSSLAARLVAVVSIGFVLLSSMVMCLGTMPELQVKDADGNIMEHPTLVSIETTCIIWFTLEYILRFLSASNKFRFAFNFENIIDVVVILPFYVVLILTHLGSDVMEIENVQRTVQVFHIMRIARIFKLVRHSQVLQTFVLSLKRSLNELSLLFMCLGIGVYMFSLLQYSVEESCPGTLFTSFPQALWWAINTMTTLCNGDIYPKTVVGMITAAVTRLCGIIIIALQLSLITRNFVIEYNKRVSVEIAAKHEIERVGLSEKDDARDRPGRQCSL